MCVGLHVKYRYSIYHILIKHEFDQQIKKYSNIEFQVNPSPVGTEVFHAGGRTDLQTDMTKLTVAFRNYANAPINTLYFAITYADNTKVLISLNSIIRLKNSFALLLFYLPLVYCIRPFQL
jgi:hypothetical protein